MKAQKNTILIGIIAFTILLSGCSANQTQEGNTNLQSDSEREIIIDLEDDEQKEIDLEKPEETHNQDSIDNDISLTWNKYIYEDLGIVINYPKDINLEKRDTCISLSPTKDQTNAFLSIGQNSDPTLIDSICSRTSMGAGEMIQKDHTFQFLGNTIVGTYTTYIEHHDPSQNFVRVAFHLGETGVQMEFRQNQEENYLEIFEDILRKTETV